MESQGKQYRAQGVSLEDARGDEINVVIRNCCGDDVGVEAVVGDKTRVAELAELLGEVVRTY